MSKPITITLELPEENFNYDDDLDYDVLRRACGQVLLQYIHAGGNLGAWTIEAEPVELSEWQGIRLILDGNTLG